MKRIAAALAVAAAVSLFSVPAIADAGRGHGLDRHTRHGASRHPGPHGYHHRHVPPGHAHRWHGPHRTVVVHEYHHHEYRRVGRVGPRPAVVIDLPTVVIPF
jgi:hypothetical protein